MAVKEGLPYPRGATWDGKGVNFALFSANATKVEVCLFDSQARTKPSASSCRNTPTRSGTATCRSSARALSTATACTARTNPKKAIASTRTSCCSTPTRARTSASLTWDPAVFGYTLERREGGPVLRRARQRALHAEVRGGRSRLRLERASRRSRPRALGPHHRLRDARARLHQAASRTCPSASAAPSAASRTRTWSATSRRSASPRSSCCRSTPSSTTAILLEEEPDELLGLQHRSASSRRTRATPPTRRGACSEFKEMVARFHDAGLEVILDVVYNHTAEGNERGPTLSFRGIDNASYYRLLPDQKRYYINDTGTGNTLNLSHPRVIQMVTDSLRYWVEEMHVDGFRFDLGTILAREPRRLRHRQRLPEGVPAGPGARKREAHRRALGLRSGRLPGRRASRPAGRSGTTSSATRCATSGAAQAPAARARAAPVRLAPTSSTTAAASPGRASTSSPRTTASR